MPSRCRCRKDPPYFVMRRRVRGSLFQAHRLLLGSARQQACPLFHSTNDVDQLGRQSAAAFIRPTPPSSVCCRMARWGVLPFRAGRRRWCKAARETGRRRHQMRTRTDMQCSQAAMLRSPTSAQRHIGLVGTANVSLSRLLPCDARDIRLIVEQVRDLCHAFASAERRTPSGSWPIRDKQICSKVGSDRRLWLDRQSVTEASGPVREQSSRSGR